MADQPGRVRLILQVEDPEDEDRGHAMGITASAYDRLSDVLADAGFAILEGPDNIPDPSE